MNAAVSNGVTIKPLYQVFLMIISSGIIFLALLCSFDKKTLMLEPVPFFENLTPEMVSELKEDPSDISVGLYVRDFSRFDMVKGEFIMSGSVWFVFNPYKIPLDLVGQFTFEKGKILEKSIPYTLIFGDSVFARYDVKVEFFSPLEYRSFPLDGHKIALMLAHRYISPKDYTFISNDNNLQVPNNRTIANSEWLTGKGSVRTGYLGDRLDVYDPRKTAEYPIVIFSREYFRSGMRNFLLILLPIILILFISLFIFSLDPKVYTTAIISMATAAISALIGYRFVIESLSPKVGYFMLSDYLYFTFLFASFMVFIMSFMIDKMSLRQKYAAVLFIHGFISLASLYAIQILT